MVISYFTSYVYGTSSPPSSSSSSSSSSSRGSGSPQPSRANSVRRPVSSSSSSSSGASGGGSRRTRSTTNNSTHLSAGSKGKGRASGSVYEGDCKGPGQGLQEGGDGRRTHSDPQLALIDHINAVHSLYDVLGVSSTFKSNDELRRAYFARCRACHPDKFPHYAEEATGAFQRVSLAYETLSKPSSRRAYDLSGHHEGFGATHPGAHCSDTGQPYAHSADFGDETLRSVLYSMYCDFLDKGDFQMVRVLVEALNASHPGLNLSPESVDGIEAALRRLRQVLLSGQKHFAVVRFELIRLYEIQHDLRQLSYFDVFGRLRLSLQLARVTLSIPMAIDKSMREDDEYDDEDVEVAAGFVDAGDEDDVRNTQVVRKGLLGPRIASVLGLAVAVLEKGERII